MGFPMAGPMAHLPDVEYWSYSLLSLTRDRNQPDSGPSPLSSPPVAETQTPRHTARRPAEAPTVAAYPSTASPRPDPALLVPRAGLAVGRRPPPPPSVLGRPAGTAQPRRRNGRSPLGKGGLRGSASEAGAQHRSPPPAVCSSASGGSTAGAERGAKPFLQLM